MSIDFIGSISLIKFVDKMMHDKVAGGFVGVESSLDVSLIAAGAVAITDNRQCAGIPRTGSGQGVSFYDLSAHGLFDSANVKPI